MPPRALTPTETRILDLILRADRAGSPFTTPQLRQRMGNAPSGGGINAIIKHLEDTGLISVVRATRCANVLRRPKAAMPPRGSSAHVDTSNPPFLPDLDGGAE